MKRGGRGDMPVYVFVRIKEFVEVPYGGCMPQGELSDATVLCPVGVLSGYDGLLPETAAKLIEDYDGVELRYFVVPLLHRPGYRGALIATGVMCKSILEAEGLRGFTHLFDRTGDYFVGQLQNGDGPIFEHPEFVGRTPFVGEGLPDYENGAAVFSLVPLGRLGRQVYFEDDPEWVYWCARGEGMMDDAAAIAACQEWRERNVA